MLARAKLRVIGYAATLKATDKVAIGSNFEVAWTGPNNAGDYITLVPAKTAGGEHETKEGSPVRLRAPQQPGPYEPRYQTDGSNLVMARAPSW